MQQPRFSVLVQPYLDRFMAYHVQDDGCWLWMRAKNKEGYGVFWDGSRNQKVHRLAYEMWIGPIPAGLYIDHLCRVPNCVNPDHLEAVTNGENVLRGNSVTAQHARKTHCKRGHAFDEANTYIDPDGGRHCKACADQRLTPEQKREKWQKWAHKTGHRKVKTNA